MITGEGYRKHSKILFLRILGGARGIIKPMNVTARKL
jgi:hypothetical protein